MKIFKRILKIILLLQIVPVLFLILHFVTKNNESLYAPIIAGYITNLIIIFMLALKWALDKLICKL